VAVPQPQCPLADNTTWRYIWAVGSLRPFDIVVGLILLTLLIRGDWVFKARRCARHFSAFWSRYSS
jgi:hypothetical protein